MAAVAMSRASSAGHLLLTTSAAPHTSPRLLPEALEVRTTPGEAVLALSQSLFDAIVDGKAQLARERVEEALKAGADPLVLISETMIPAMDEVGRLFQE